MMSSLVLFYLEKYMITHFLYLYKIMMTLSGFFHQKCQQKGEVLIVGALSVVKHLLPRLSFLWEPF